MLTRLAFVLLLGCTAVFGQEYDVVLRGGRVMDPETGLDATRNVGISGGKIARISSDPLPAKWEIDASGLVVAPGFIDLHQHGQDIGSCHLKALDGVTTALEMEIGAPDVFQFLKQKEGHSLINYGTSASHSAARALAFGTPITEGIVPKSGPATNEHATPERMQIIVDRLRSEVAAGALSIGMGIQYTPGVTRSEVIQMFRLAASYHVPIITHVRSSGRVEPGSSVEAISEVIAAAAVTGASLHIAHINSSCLKESLDCLEMVAGARARGLDVTTEAYPYTAGMTDVTSALFNPGWTTEFGVDYNALRLPDTGERLTKERFEALHASKHPILVLLDANTQDMVDRVIRDPLVMIASDGLPGHPRNAGTYSRILAHYVREEQSLSLMDAIRKMSLMPAQRLETATPAARAKGRLQEGADADIVVFDPRTVADRATYQAPMEPSVGVNYLIVGGTVVIDRGKILPNVFPGRALTRSPEAHD